MNERDLPQVGLLKRSIASKKVYAQSFIKTAITYNEHEIYDRMSGFIEMAQKIQQERHDLPLKRPIIHIDIGCGTGHLLGKMADQYKERNRNFCLIGIEINEILARYSVEQLLSQGQTVSSHIHSREGVEFSDGRHILRRTFPFNEHSLQMVDVTSDQQIVIVQDDARNRLEILSRILSNLHRMNITHVDSISFGLPGLGADVAMQDSKDLHLSNEILTRKECGKVVQALTARTAQMANEVLGVGGLLLCFMRLDNGKKLREMYRQITRKEFPVDAEEQLFAKMHLAQSVLGPDAKKFYSRVGAVLYPAFNEVEMKGNMQYSTYSMHEEKTGKPNLSGDMDLYALGLVRADLHGPGISSMQMNGTPGRN